MFKTSFLLEPSSNDPFRYRGDIAASEILSLYPSVCGYVQSRALPDQVGAAFSGCMELFFAESAVALDAALSDPVAMLSDSRVKAVVTGMERVVVRMPEYGMTSQIKGIYPFCRKQGMEVAKFQQHWWQVHGPIAALTEEALGYVQIHPGPDYYMRLTPVYDGITEIYWKDVAAAGRAIDSRQMKEDQGGDAPNFVDLESVALFLAEEEIVIKY